MEEVKSATVIAQKKAGFSRSFTISQLMVEHGSPHFHVFLRYGDLQWWWWRWLGWSWRTSCSLGCICLTSSLDLLLIHTDSCRPHWCFFFGFLKLLGPYSQLRLSRVFFVLLLYNLLLLLLDYLHLPLLLTFISHPIFSLLLCFLFFPPLMSPLTRSLPRLGSFLCELAGVFQDWISNAKRLEILIDFVPEFGKNSLGLFPFLVNGCILDRFFLRIELLRCCVAESSRYTMPSLCRLA